jgi:hypothetical protein
MSQERPQFLYRYRHFQGEHYKYTGRIFTDSILYFPSPPQLNDPFDCRVHFQPTASLPAIRKMFEELLERNYPNYKNLNREQRRNLIQKYKKVARKRSIEDITWGIQNDLNERGVLSLSASNNNILLWSHYAAGHSGICLQFLAMENTPFFNRAQRVDYLIDYPQVHLHDDPLWHIKSFLLTKANDWNYEQEWRIIDTDGPGEKVFSEELLVGVILGARIASEDRDYILNLVERRKAPIKIYQASINKGSYSLTIDDY